METQKWLRNWPKRTPKDTHHRVVASPIGRKNYFNKLRLKFIFNFYKIVIQIITNIYGKVFFMNAVGLNKITQPTDMAKKFTCNLLLMSEHKFH